LAAGSVGLAAALTLLVPAAAGASEAPPPAGGASVDAAAVQDQTVQVFGDAAFHGAPDPAGLNQPIVGLATTPAGKGYWLVARDGGIFSYGDAVFHGSTGNIRLNQPIVGIAGTPSGKGYWLVARDGGIFSYGDAVFHGSTGNIRLNQPVVAMTPTPTGKGYWLLTGDGGIFTFGDAVYQGSLPAVGVSAPAVAMALTPTAKGYWIAAATGGVYAFGDAVFHGAASMGGSESVTGIAATTSGRGYWLLTRNGAVLTFGDASLLGQPGAQPGARPFLGLSRSPSGLGYTVVTGDPDPLRRNQSGSEVAAIQQSLLDLGFWLNDPFGVYGYTTEQAVMAFQKWNGMARTGVFDAATRRVLVTATRPTARSVNGDGIVAEVDKTRQVVLYTRDGRVEWVFNSSTGNGQPYSYRGRREIAITPEGKWAIVYAVNGLDISPLGELWRPRYFVDGFAIHGSPNVPGFPASHGCVRVANPVIDFIWAENMLPRATSFVWVYA
jgi:hypothetical protein